MTVAIIEQIDSDEGELALALSGELDMVNAATVQQELLDAITNQPTAVRLDLSELTFMDSAGLRILFALADRLETLQITLDVVVAPGSVPRRAMELAGFPVRVTSQ